MPEAGTDARPASPGGRLRSSLLTPCETARPLRRLDWLLLAATYVLAVGLRWGLRDVHPYTAEATHFVVAQGLWDSATNIRYPDVASPFEDYTWFFWQRPLLALPFWPAAQHSFLAYRTMHVLLVGAAPALGAWLLRSLGVGRPWAFAAAVVLCVHPALVPWTVLVLPDALTLTLMLAALLAAHHGRPAGTAGLLLAASWVKEVAFVTSLSLFVLALWRDADGRSARMRPLHVGRFAAWIAPVVPLAFLPLWVSMQANGVFPGFRPGGDEALMYETLWLLVYLAPLPLLGLVNDATRRLALVAMAWPAFFLLYHYTQDKAIESWYNVIPASMTVLAAAAGLWALWRHAARAPWPQWGAAAVAVAMAALLSIQVAVPDHEPLNARLVTPWSERGQWDLRQVRANELSRDDDLAAMLAVPGTAERGRWFALDVDWSLIMFPVAAQADEVVKVYSLTHELREDEVRAWAWAVENLTDATLLFHRDDIPINVATRQAYAECSVTKGQYTMLQASRCRGHGGDLWQHYRSAPRP